DGDLLAGDARFQAAAQEVISEAGVVPRRRDEQAARVLDAVGRNSAQDRVLDHALTGRDRVLDRVAPARVEEAVETTCRPRGQVAPLHQCRCEAPHRRVACDAGPRGAAADDEDFRLQSRHSYRPQNRSAQGPSLSSAQGPSLSSAQGLSLKPVALPLTFLGTAPFGNSPYLESGTWRGPGARSGTPGPRAIAP